MSGSRVPGSARGGARRGGLHGRRRAASHVRADLHGWHGPRGSGAAGIRSGRHQLSRHTGNIFHDPRSHHPEPAGQRRGHAIPLRHLLPVGRAGKSGAQGARRDGRRVGRAYRHGTGAGAAVLQGRGVSPALRGAASAAGLLRLRRRAQGGKIPRHVCAPPEVRRPAPGRARPAVHAVSTGAGLAACSYM